MLMAQAGTQGPEKEFTFTTPVAHGLSYKLCNPDHPDFKAKLAQCWDYLEAAVRKGNEELVRTEDLVKRALGKQTDFWVSVDEQGKIVGSFIIGSVSYPTATGIYSESCGGTFVFTDMFPMVEQFYKSLGFSFVEVVGRKGWERELAPMGYKLNYVSTYKRI